MIKPMFWAPNADTQAKQEWEVTQSFWTKLYFKCVILVLLIWKKKISVEKQILLETIEVFQNTFKNHREGR